MQEYGLRDKQSINARGSSNKIEVGKKSQLKFCMSCDRQPARAARLVAFSARLQGTRKTKERGAKHAGRDKHCKYEMTVINVACSGP